MAQQYSKQYNIKDVKQHESAYERKVKELEEELSTTKYNKRTQHHIGLVKAQLARLKEEYQKKEKELELYKVEALKKIDDQIYNVIQNISNEVLGKSISLQDHEQLIIDALEKAKKEGALR